MEMTRFLAVLSLCALTACSFTVTSTPAGSTTAPTSRPPAASTTHPTAPGIVTAASSWPTPNQTLTPGAIIPGCTYPVTTARTVTETEKAKVRAEYHYTGPTDLAHAEIDHRVPHSLCGSDAVANLWVEVYDGVKRTTYTANHKDTLELRIASLVRRHLMTLPAAQRLFLGDWRVAWCTYVAVAGDGVKC